MCVLQSIPINKMFYFLRVSLHAFPGEQNGEPRLVQVIVIAVVVSFLFFPIA